MAARQEPVYSRITSGAPSGKVGGTIKADLDRLKGNFLASLNHEIRTPLSGVLGMTDLLLETDLNDEQREYAETSRECAIQLLDTLNSVLEYSAVSSGRGESTSEEFPLRQLMHSVQKEMESRADSKGISLQYKVDSSVPETLIGDPHALRQILCQLVRNGVKFTSRGHVKASARLEIQPDGCPTLFLEVTDSGIGISQEQLNAIFESFEQAETGLARRYAGLGLGLAITERLVNRLNGVIEVNSRAGYGSSFLVRLPVEIPAQTTPDKHPITGTHILVVEDDPVAQKFLLLQLSKNGYKVDIAANGAQGIAAATATQYNLILMDMQMPLTDGLEATEAIRAMATHRHTPILVLTANTMDEHRAACVNAGAEAFLSKPVQTEELLSTIQRLLSNKKPD